jgi:hypothetical protein
MLYKKRRKYLKVKIDELQINRRPRISETCTGALITLRMVTSLELNSKGREG